jgi:hypothetical protein
LAARWRLTTRKSANRCWKKSEVWCLPGTEKGQFRKDQDWYDGIVAIPLMFEVTFWWTT